MTAWCHWQCSITSVWFV